MVLTSAATVLFIVLQWGKWVVAGDGVPFLEQNRKKLTGPGFGGHGEEPWPTGHKASVSALAAAWLIGSKSILVCEGAPSDLGIVAVPLFLRCCLGGG